MTANKCMQVNVSIPADDIEELDAIAHERRISRSALVRAIVGEWLDERAEVSHDNE